MKDLFTRNFLPYVIDCTNNGCKLLNHNYETFIELDYVFDDVLICLLAAKYDCLIERINYEIPEKKLTRITLYQEGLNPLSIHRDSFDSGVRYFMILDDINKHFNKKYNS